MDIESKPTFQKELKRLKREISVRTGPDLLDAMVIELAKLKSAIQLLTDRLHITETYIKVRDEQITGEIPDLAEITLPATAEFDATWSLGAPRCFHHLEYTESGIPYRWSGPSDQIHFTVMIDRHTPKTITLSFVGSKNSRNATEIGCMVDGEPISLTYGDNDSIMTLNGTMSARPRKGPTFILFRIPYVEVADPRGDDRLIGIAFSKLTVS